MSTHTLDKPQTTQNGVIIGLLVGFRDASPLVVFPGNPDPAGIPARTLQALEPADIGAEVALMFEAGDLSSPILVGRLLRPDTAPVREEAEVEIDGETETLDLAAKKQLTLRCGKASITLTADGKVLVKGAYISSRSTGQNRIKGGSVHLN